VHAVVIVQTVSDNNSGAANYGTEFQLNTTTNSAFSTDNQLTSIEFFKGSLGNGGATTTTFLDVYAIGTGTYTAGSAPDFSGGSAPAGLDYLGTSSNSVDYVGAADDSSLLWNFSIDLSGNLDERLFAVVSTTSGVGGLVGTSLRIADSPSLSNITSTDSNPLFGGAPSTESKDTTYNITVDAVPEPGSFALLAGMFGLTWVMLRRRA
jgi:hypothetical protein